MRLSKTDIYNSFPVQLFILHFRKYQVLLVFWYILVSTINSDFMKGYGADALFFAPEYLGSVNAISAAIVGVALGVFVMSWNITTFILHSKRCKFLATVEQPFLEYCLNNFGLPLLFILFYFIKLYHFDEGKELMNAGDILVLVAGIVGGFILLLTFSFAYFFGAEKSIRRSIAPKRKNGNENNSLPGSISQPSEYSSLVVNNYLTTRFRFRKVRTVEHYGQDFLDLVFKRHHFSGIISIVLAFMFLILLGFYMDAKFFQVPAAASILIFLAVMMALIGSLTYFLQSWSLPFFIVLVLGLNMLYQYGIIDPRNKAYGLNYTNTNERPAYTFESLKGLCGPVKIGADKANMIRILDNWKKKQKEARPVMIFINVSGGGLRSATFVMNTLQHLDSITHGDLMNHTMMISGSSGGMLAAAYYRELCRQKLKGRAISIYDPSFTDNISQDLLNTLFSSMIARDVFSPTQRFSAGGYKYIKDRGYAFEQKLNENCKGLLGGQLKDYSEDEQASRIPLMVFNSTITRDGRRMMICSQPISFMMKPTIYAADTSASPDAVDFTALFARQNPLNIRLLTALRMNATFPYVLPNVWLPTDPVIDVMDAGLRDNFGQETTLRFVENFRDWIFKNTGGVVIVQLRDRVVDNWQQPFETGAITDVITKPATILQQDLFKLQDYAESDQFSYMHDAMDSGLNRIVFMYVPENEENRAALNFHLTATEKRDIKTSFDNAYNQDKLKKLLKLLK